MFCLSLPPPHTEARSPVGVSACAVFTNVPCPRCWTLSHALPPPAAPWGHVCAQSPQPAPDCAPLRLPCVDPGGEVPAAACRVGGPTWGAHSFLGCAEASWLAPTPLLEGGLGHAEQDTQKPGSCPPPRGGWARRGAVTGPGCVWLGLPVGWPAPSWGLRGVLRAEAKRGPPTLPTSGSPRLAG